MLRPDGAVKLLDFGIAKLDPVLFEGGQTTYSKKLLGTPAIRGAWELCSTKWRFSRAGQSCPQKNTVDPPARSTPDYETAVAESIGALLLPARTSTCYAGDSSRHDVRAGPATKPDPDLKVRTALGRAATKIGNRFEKQPLIEASLRQTIYAAYRKLGLFKEARTHADEALKVRTRILGPQHPDTLLSIENLALLSAGQGDYAQAATLHKKVLDARLRVLGKEHSQTLDSMNNLGVNYMEQEKWKDALNVLAPMVETSQ